MDRVRDLNDILMFQTSPRQIIYKDIESPKYSRKNYLHFHLEEEYRRLREAGDKAWKNGDKELSTAYHERARQIWDGLND